MTGPGTPRPRRARVVLHEPASDDEADFVAAVQRSRMLHRPWVAPPDTAAAFHQWLARQGMPSQEAYLVRLRQGRDLVGLIALSEIVLGNFRSAYVGYYAFAGYNGRGLMREGLQAVARRAFGTLQLHRLEANIQPGNAASIALVQACGFRHEGFSPRYLKINGRWRDHERWALLADE